MVFLRLWLNQIWYWISWIENILFIKAELWKCVALTQHLVLSPAELIPFSLSNTTWSFSRCCAVVQPTQVFGRQRTDLIGKSCMTNNFSGCRWFKVFSTSLVTAKPKYASWEKLTQILSHPCNYKSRTIRSRKRAFLTSCTFRMFRKHRRPNFSRVNIMVAPSWHVQDMTLVFCMKTAFWPLPVLQR